MSDEKYESGAHEKNQKQQKVQRELVQLKNALTSKIFALLTTDFGAGADISESATLEEFKQQH